MSDIKNNLQDNNRQISVAMILAAGFGKRMLPLTKTCPKPLLKVNDCPLIEYHIRRLVAGGISDIVINVSYLGQQIIDYLGDGSRFAARIHYSIENEPLETFGGIVNALPLIKKALLESQSSQEAFILVNGDVWCPFSVETLQGAFFSGLDAGYQACLALVENPEHNLAGDFSLDGMQLVAKQEERSTYTFSGISVFSSSLFEHYKLATPKLKALIDRAIEDQLAGAICIAHEWVDVGTPERLAELDAQQRLKAETQAS